MPEPMTDAALTALIEKWREAAGWEVTDGSPAFGQGLDQCADELEAVLARAVGPSVVDALPQTVNVREDECRVFYDRCQELGAHDTDIIKHALEDQQRVREELTPLSMENGELKRQLALRAAHASTSEP